MDFYCSKWRIQFHPKWVIEFDRTYWIIDFSSITSHFGLYRMNNCRFKRQNLNRSSAAWVGFGKRRMNNCRLKRQFLMVNSAVWVWFGKHQMNNCRFKRQYLNRSSTACLDLVNARWTIVVLNDKTWYRGCMIGFAKLDTK